MAKTAAKGTIDNPYSMSECDSMLDAGTWPGGYVRDDGVNVSYLMKSVTTQAYSGSGSGCDWSGSDDSVGSDMNDGDYNNKDYNDDVNTEAPVSNTYKQGTNSFNGTVNLYGGPEGYGFVRVKFIGNIDIRGNNICAYVEATAAFPGVSYSALLDIYQNDKLFCSIPISSNGLPRDMIYAKGHVPVGQCEVALPKTGSVTVTITMGALYEDGSGRFARNTSYSKKIN